MFKKLAIAFAAAAALAAASISASAPAEAHCFWNYGYHQNYWQPHYNHYEHETHYVQHDDCQWVWKSYQEWSPEGPVWVKKQVKECY